MHKGSCLCGRVRYEYDAEIEEISRCYCYQCQKGQGTAFVAVAPILTAKLSFTYGEEYLKEFRASPSKARVFCSECGSPLYSARDDLPHIMRLRLGALDTKTHPSVQYHACVSQKVNWYEIGDDYTQHLDLPK